MKQILQHLKSGEMEIATEPCPQALDTWLGVTGSYSQGVREMVCRIGLDSSYHKAADDLCRFSQVTLSYQSLRKVFQSEGQKVRIARRTGEVVPTFKAEQYRVNANKPTCVITGADGFQVPLITDKEKRKHRVIDAHLALIPIVVKSCALHKEQ
jgi:hypothetical protein